MNKFDHLVRLALLMFTLSVAACGGSALPTDDCEAFESCSAVAAATIVCDAGSCSCVASLPGENRAVSCQLDLTCTVSSVEAGADANACPGANPIVVHCSRPPVARAELDRYVGAAAHADCVSSGVTSCCYSPGEVPKQD